MRRYLRSTVGCPSLVEVQTYRRFMTIRVTCHPRDASTKFVVPLEMQSRAYSQQQQHNPGHYPPPPPPNYSYNQQHNPYGYNPNQQGYGGQQHPMYPPQYQQSSQEPILGSKDRPIVVVPASRPKSSWSSRVWFVLLCLIGASAALHLLEEYEVRTQDSGPKVGGGGGMRGGMANMFGSTEPKPVDLDTQEITFDNVRGCDEAKEELEEIVEFLKNPKKFVALGGRLPKGALLIGPPGCGKTMLAKAIAKEAGVKFYYATGSEFDEMFVGVGARRVRELFAAAKANGPSLIFIDEIDALGGKRSKTDHAYSRMTLNQLLAEMDGFQSSDEVIVLAATNTPDSLDKALTRPGRFDISVSIDPPDQKGRADILDLYLGKIKKDLSVKASEIAKGTTGFTGAELSNLVNIAAIRAAVLDLTAVTSQEIEYAKDRVMMGMENKTKVIPEAERRITAYHEGGHALVAIMLGEQNGGGQDPVHKATIVPRGNGIMGLVQQQPNHDRYSQTKQQCLDRIKVCLAGRIAEELILGSDNITTGAASDFQQATRMATAMVRKFGFSDALGTLDFESADSAEGAYMSDTTKERIEREVQTIVKSSFVTTKEILVANRENLDRIASQLLLHETLTGDDLKKVMQGEVIEMRPKPIKRVKTSTPPPPPKGGLKAPIPTIAGALSPPKKDLV